MTLYSSVVEAVPLAGATVTTMLTANSATTKGLRLVRWGVSFAGTDATKAPVRVELLRLTSTGTSTSVTPKQIDPTSSAPLGTARNTFTAEPTASDVIEAHYISPAGGYVIEAYAPDERVHCPASGIIGIRLLAPDAVNVNAFMIWDE